MTALSYPSLRFLVLTLPLLLTGACQRWSSFETAYPRALVPAAAAPSQQAVAAGTRVDVVLTRDLSSEDTPARTPAFVTRTAIHAVDGTVVAPAGSPVTMRVQQLRRRMLGRPGALIVSTVAVVTPDGGELPITGHARVYGRSNVDLATGPSIGRPERAWVFDVLRLFIVGGRARLPSGFVIPAVVEG